MRILEIIKEERKKTAMLLANFGKIAEKYPQKQLYERMMNGEKRYYYKIEGDPKRYYIGWKQPELLRGLLADYHAADILLGRDLFVTMDGPNEDLDVAAIDRFIIHTILPLCTGADDSGIENDF